MPPQRRPLADRFWEKVKKTDGCWLWTGSVGSQHGYGQINEGGEGKPLLAHRVSWELHHGPIPNGMYVLHGCDNRKCVRPDQDRLGQDHLFLGTHADNMADMHKKKRYRVPGFRGEKHSMAKLTEAQIKEIRRRYANREANQNELAVEYNTSQANISLIVLRKHWGWLK